MPVFGPSADVSTLDIPKALGTQYYVSAIDGNDANSGRTPEEAFATIGAAFAYEDTSFFAPADREFQVTGKEGADNYLRFVYSGAGTSGAIRWHCRYIPLSADGFVEAV